MRAPSEGRIIHFPSRPSSEVNHIPPLNSSPDNILRFKPPVSSIDRDADERALAQVVETLEFHVQDDLEREGVEGGLGHVVYSLKPPINVWSGWFPQDAQLALSVNRGFGSTQLAVHTVPYDDPDYRLSFLHSETEPVHVTSGNRDAIGEDIEVVRLLTYLWEHRELTSLEGLKAAFRKNAEKAAGVSGYAELAINRPSDLEPEWEYLFKDKRPAKGLVTVEEDRVELLISQQGLETEGVSGLDRIFASQEAGWVSPEEIDTQTLFQLEGGEFHFESEHNFRVRKLGEDRRVTQLKLAIHLLRKAGEPNQFFQGPPRTFSPDNIA